MMGLNTEFSQHKTAYFILALQLLGFVIIFLALWPNIFWQRIAIIFTMFFYVIWGAVVHRRHDHFTLKIFYEYLAVASLAGVLLLILTL